MKVLRNYDLSLSTCQNTENWVSVIKLKRLHVTLSSFSAGLFFHIVIFQLVFTVFLPIVSKNVEEGILES